MIVRQKVLRAAEMFVTTMKGRRRGKGGGFIQEVTPLIWQLPWASTLTEEQYRGLQKLGNFDTKTSSWVETPSDIQKLGGALFVDRRFDKVFVYHNTAPCF